METEEKQSETYNSTEKGEYTVLYNDLNTGREVKETFENVDRISEVGNPDGLGMVLIVQHIENVENTVREEVKLTSIL
jgi:hypothetical protein